MTIVFGINDKTYIPNIVVYGLFYMFFYKRYS